MVDRGGTMKRFKALLIGIILLLSATVVWAKFLNCPDIGCWGFAGCLKGGTVSGCAISCFGGSTVFCEVLEY